MIDLTPLEVRKKKGDFKKALRGYEPGLVDDFLDVVADRLDQLVRENMAMSEKLTRLEHQVADNRERERALTDALVTAQAMREEMQKQTARESDLVRRTAEQEAMQIRADAMQAREREEEVLRRLRARQQQLLQSYRTFLAREMAELQVIGETLEIEGLSPMDAPQPRTSPRGTRPDATPAVDSYPSRIERSAEPVPSRLPAPSPVIAPVMTAPAAALMDIAGDMVVMGAVDAEPLPEEEPFAPEPVDEWEPEIADEVIEDVVLQDQLALRDAVVRNDIIADDPAAAQVSALELVDMSDIDLGGADDPEIEAEPAAGMQQVTDVFGTTDEEEIVQAEAELAYELELEPADAVPTSPSVIAEEEIGAPDHDANVLLENALKAGYRLDLDDEDDIGELLLEDEDDTGGGEMPADWLDKMIDDEER